MCAKADHRRIGLEERRVLQPTGFTGRQIQWRHDDSFNDLPECLSYVIALSEDNAAVNKDKVIRVGLKIEIMGHDSCHLLLQNAASRRYGADRIGTCASANGPRTEGG